MRKIVVNLAFFDEKKNERFNIPWDGWIEVPGLAVIKTPVWDKTLQQWIRGDTWQIINIPTGLRVSYRLRQRQDALKLAHAIAPLTVWNDANEIMAHENNVVLYERIREIRQEIGV